MIDRKVVLSIGKYLLFSVILTGILLILLSFLRYWLDISDTFVNAGIILTYVLTCFFFGMMTGKRMKTKRFIYGALVGGIYFLLLLILSVVFSGADWNPGSDFITVLLLCVAGGTLGGMLS